tara:strand:- start:708 stop:896 length:189 start_codon:yes stop_codon:yes gene_type:complete
MVKTSILRVTQIKSGIGYDSRAKATLKALGLRKINQSVELPNNPATNGMINAIPYLLKVEKI